MDQDFAQPDELSARREAMRERLRLRAERVLEAVEEIGDPKSFLEVERAARAILVVDKMVMQLFSPPRPKSPALIYDDGTRYDYGDRGRGYASRLPVEKAGQGSFDRPVDAAIVAFGDTSPSRPVVNNGSKGEDEITQPAEIESVENTEQALATEFDPELEAKANAIFAAYLEAMRLEREAEEREERYGLGP